MDKRKSIYNENEELAETISTLLVSSKNQIEFLLDYAESNGFDLDEIKQSLDYFIDNSINIRTQHRKNNELIYIDNRICGVFDNLEEYKSKLYDNNKYTPGISGYVTSYGRPAKVTNIVPVLDLSRIKLDSSLIKIETVIGDLLGTDDTVLKPYIEEFENIVNMVREDKELRKTLSNEFFNKGLYKQYLERTYSEMDFVPVKSVSINDKKEKISIPMYTWVTCNIR